MAYLDRTPEAWAEAAGLKRRGREYVGPCPLCGGKDRFHVRTGRDGVSAVAGCRGCLDGQPDSERRARFGELARAVFGDSEHGPRTGGNGAGRPRTPRRPEKAATGRRGAVVGPSDADRRAYAVRVWQDSKAAAEDFPLAASSKPARLWLRARNLWWESLGPPPMVRWCARLPAEGWPYGGPPPTSGALVALLAPPAAWVSAWPDLPAPSAVQCVFVGPDGAPISPGKRTFGVSAGAVGLIGPPAPSIDGLIVCEGLADGLALAARRWETVAVTCTTPPTSGPVFEYAAQWPAVTIHSDRDGTGLESALTLEEGLRAAHVKAAAIVQPCGFKDAAAYTEVGNEPLADLAAARADVLDLAAEHEAEGLPRWEALRRAALTIAPAEDAGPPWGRTGAT